MLVQDHSILPRPLAIDAEFYIEGGAPTSAQVQVVQGMNYRLTMEVHYEKVYICNVFLYFPLPINGVATDPVLKENESSCHLVSVHDNDGVDKL